MKVYNNNLALYYKDLLISNFPLTNLKTYERYKYNGENLILDALKRNLNIKFQLGMYLYFCNKILQRKKDNLAIYKSDHQKFLCCLFALIKLKILDEDDCVLIVKKKKFEFS